MSTTIRYRTFQSPFGEILLYGGDSGLRGLAFQRGRQAVSPAPDWEASPRSSLLLETKRQLEAYFAGKRKVFDLPVELQGTAFQLKVWRALMRLPYGKALAYSDMARRIRRPTAIRAVGAANGANPISIIVPCHRLIGKNGSLVKYGGGLDIKRALLELEGAL